MNRLGKTFFGLALLTIGWFLLGLIICINLWGWNSDRRSLGIVIVSLWVVVLFVILGLFIRWSSKKSAQEYAKQTRDKISSNELRKRLPKDPPR